MTARVPMTNPPDHAGELREAAAALIAKLDEAFPVSDKRPTIAELERMLASGSSGAIEIKPDGSIYVAPRDEIEALRAALAPPSKEMS